MLANVRYPWETLEIGKSLLFRDLLPYLHSTRLYKKNLNSLVESSYKKNLHLFPDLEEEILHGLNTAHTPAIRSRDPLNIYLSEVKSLGVSSRNEEVLLARTLEIVRLVLDREIHEHSELLRNHPKLEKTLAAGEIPLTELLDLLRENRPDPSEGPAPSRSRLEKVEMRVEELTRIRSLLISRNLHLVPTYARRYRNCGVPYQDLIQEGNASLLRAADKFDWKKGVRFATYAQWWINQAMLKAIYCQSRVVRVPVYLNQKMKKIRDANREFWGESGQNMTDEQISKDLNEPLRRIRRAMKANVGTYSLDQENENNEDYNLRSVLVDRHVDEVEDNPEGPGLEERIEEVLETLPEKERRILILRYGLKGEKIHTLDEVSKIFRVSRERVRQIQVQALRKLLRPSRNKRLAAFL